LRRFIAVVISTLFVLGLAATAFAIHAEIPAETQSVVAKGATQIMLGGSVRVRGELRDIDFDSDTATDAYYDERVRLSVDAKVTDNVQGFIMLESGTSTNDVYTWGKPTPGGATGIYSTGTGGGGNVKPTDITLLEGWILYTSGPAGLKVGHMPLALGNNLFFNHTKFGDDAIVVFVNPVPELHLAALAIKFEEGSTGVPGTGNAQDQDGYVALAAYKGAGFNLSGDVTWVNLNGGSTFVLSPGDVVNIGVRGDVGVVEGLNLYGDVEFQTGKFLKDTAGELDVKGYAFQVGAKLAVSGVNLGAEFGLGSGDDNAGDADFDLYITSLGSHLNVPNAYVYGYRVLTAAGATNTGISNTTYVRVNAGTNITDALSAEAKVFWLQATEDVSLRGGAPDNALGWEVDGTIKYKVARNLLYWVEGGYLIAGDAYNDAAGEADDAYAVRHGIELTF
jgi:hypothetical protein